MSETWVSHVSHEWVMSRITKIVSGKPINSRAQSCLSESYETWVIWDMTHSHSLLGRLYQTRVTHVCGLSHMNEFLHVYHTWLIHLWRYPFMCVCVEVGCVLETKAIARFERVVSPRIRHVTYEWVTSRMNESRHVWWVTSHMQESCHTWVCHVTYECVIPLMTDSFVNRHVTYGWVVSQMMRHCADDACRWDVQYTHEYMPTHVAHTWIHAYIDTQTLWHTSRYTWIV